METLTPDVTPSSANEVSPTPRRVLLVVRVLCLVVLAAAMVRLAWIGDDALITLRNALNIAHGWGPGYNFTESVQGYTHPAWFLLWLASGWLTGEWILTIVVISVVLSVAAVAIVLWSARSIALILVAAVALGFSNAFMEYTTSGLENPLAYLMVGALVVATFRLLAQGEVPSLRSAIVVGLLASGLVLTRFDLLLLIVPLLGWLAVRLRRQGSRLLALGVALAVPVMLWCTWSWLAYSSILPNTFLAKRNLEIPAVELVVQGLRYGWVTIEHDPVTGLVLVVGLVLCFAFGRPVHRALAAGVVLYLAYVTWIGGDFMAGRFYAVPVYLLVLLSITVPVVAHSALARPRASSIVSVLVGFIAVLLVLVAADRVPSAIANPTSTRWREMDDAAAIYDARSKFIELDKGLEQWAMSLGASISVPPYPDAASTNLLAPLRDIRSAANNWPDRASTSLPHGTWPNPDGSFSDLPSDVGVLCGLLGTAGIISGPTVHWIDRCALTDRYLAAIPYAAHDFHWYVGHYERALPPGYEAAVRTGDPGGVTDPLEAARLKELWEQIR